MVTPVQSDDHFFEVLRLEGDAWQLTARLRSKNDIKRYIVRYLGNQPIKLMKESGEVIMSRDEKPAVTPRLQP